jgi:hypothetical protein
MMNTKKSFAIREYQNAPNEDTMNETRFVSSNQNLLEETKDVLKPTQVLD